jgi:ubiquinone/menaquinone biosynthesis C-methylase UbiE
MTLPGARRRLDAWLSPFPVRDGVSLISEPRAFEDPEDEYEEDIGSKTAESAGSGAYRLWRHLSRRDSGIALEVGAGSGAITLGFVESAKGFTSLVTDPSPAFLEITNRKLSARPMVHADVRYATLVGEDMHKLPSELLDLVLVQASLHHIWDWKSFLAEVYRVLAPGGVLLFQEPFSEGHLMIALALEMLLMADGPGDDDRKRLESLRAITYLLSDRTADKSHGEDKHCFFTDEVILTCASLFPTVFFLRNQSFESIANLRDVGDAFSRAASSASFLDYCRSYFADHHKVTEEGIAVFDRSVAPPFSGVERLFRHGDGPAILAVVACRKSDLTKWERQIRTSLGRARRRIRQVHRT